jgi:hypothetical protein
MVNFIHQRNVLTLAPASESNSPSVVKAQHGRYGAEDSVDLWPLAARLGIARRPWPFRSSSRVTVARC